MKTIGYSDKENRFYIHCIAPYQSELIRKNARNKGYIHIKETNSRTDLSCVKEKKDITESNFNPKLKICRLFQCRNYNPKELMDLFESISYIKRYHDTENILQLSAIRTFFLRNNLEFSLSNWCITLRKITGIKHIKYSYKTMAFNSKLDLIDWISISLDDLIKYGEEYKDE